MFCYIKSYSIYVILNLMHQYLLDELYLCLFTDILFTSNRSHLRFFLSEEYLLFTQFTSPAYMCHVLHYPFIMWNFWEPSTRNYGEWVGETQNWYNCSPLWFQWWDFIYPSSAYGNLIYHIYTLLSFLSYMQT